MSTQAGSKKTVVGRITAAYGIKGWVKVHSYTDPPENIFQFDTWLLGNAATASAGVSVKIDSYKQHGKGFVACVKGYNDRTAAEAICQRDILVDRGELPVLPEGEYYWQQLIGLRVISCYGEPASPQLLGVISSLMETGANDILVVSPCSDSIDQRERLLPYVEMYVLKVDLANQQMLVDWDPAF